MMADDLGRVNAESANSRKKIVASAVDFHHLGKPQGTHLHNPSPGTNSTASPRPPATNLPEQASSARSHQFTTAQQLSGAMPRGKSIGRWGGGSQASTIRAKCNILQL